MLLGVSIVTFCIVHLAPGGPIRVFEQPEIDPATADAITKRMGLEEPLWSQYLHWAWSLLRGDLGSSFRDGRPVSQVILERLPATLLLALSARAIGLLGIPLGVLAATHPRGRMDTLVRFVLAGLSSPPSWLLGLVVLLVVAAPSGLFPLGGMNTIGREGDIGDTLWHLSLPAVVWGAGDCVVWARHVRSAMLDVLGLDYVRTARAKGLPETQVVFKHALRNALVPATTLFGLAIPSLVAGSVALETVFSWPGIGRLAYTAAVERDYPVVMAVALLSAVLALAGMLIADVALAKLDPRVTLH